jgi:polyphosphate kinase 2 (PPK2 family)
MRSATHQPARPGTSSTPRTPARATSSVADILLSRFRIHVRARARASAKARRRKRSFPSAPRACAGSFRFPLENKLSQPSYEKKRDKWLGRLNKVVRAAGQERRSIVWVFEGWDAAGKGGAIRGSPTRSTRATSA